MREVPYDPLTQAVEMMKKADAPAGELELEVRNLNIQRAQAYALMEIAEALKEISDRLLERP